MAVKRSGTAAGKATAVIIDFSNVKGRNDYNPRHIESREYVAKIVKVVQTEAKDGTAMWVFAFALPEAPRAVYPYYCKLVDNQFWKVKALFEAVGITVGARKLKIDPNKLVNKQVGVFMEDDEYEGKLKSVIAEVIPVEDITGSPESDVEPEEDDLEEEEAPLKKKKKAPAKKQEEDDDDEDEDEDLDELEVDEL